MFKFWSQTNQESKKFLTPNLSVRSLSDCDEEERKIILKNFINKGWLTDNNLKLYVHNAIRRFGDANKANNFCPKTLDHGGPHYLYGSTLDDCCRECTHSDFWNIFSNKPKEVSYELLSYYVNELDNSDYYQHRNKFKNCFNDISNQFALDILMVEDQFIPKQEEKIVNEIYEPVLSFLSDSKWKEVNVILADAFSEYRKNSPQGYSNSVTNTISAIQAFLQILNNKKQGKGNISYLITEAQKNGLINNDSFTKQIFDNLESIFAKERQETSIAHPKKEYATEKNARIMLNLAMIFFQHCIQK
ncbi:MAG: hypothetical protein Q8P20_01625 [bacterium]|nr:hypothetical protein [bacterium]